MPKSDTWPGGTESVTMNGMDSAGSCDSVLSANSGFSVDSLEHLSAEEKACLMFLEETIESLDNDDDSGLSYDEPERLPDPGNLSAKLADLSHSMGKSNVRSSNEATKQPVEKNGDTKHRQSYLVPTPLVVASGSQFPGSGTKSHIPLDKPASSNSQFTSKHNKPAPPAPLEVNTVIPSSTKPWENTAKPAEGPLPRGPLSYEALVHLRRSASQKKTPLCPTVDHTIDSDGQCPQPTDGQRFDNVTKPDKSLAEVEKSRTGPPAVPPKPKKLPANIFSKIQNEESMTPDPLRSVRQTSNLKAVRLEALWKLGLMKENEHGAEAPVAAPKPDPRKPARNPSDPTRNPSFCSSQEKQEHKNRPLTSSASGYHPSKDEQQPVLLLHVQSRSDGLERSFKQDSNKTKGNRPEHKSSTKEMKTITEPQPWSDTPLDSVGYTTMVVPGMGSDRKDALKKLGLLKR